MSEDEVLVTVAATVFGLGGWGFWGMRVAGIVHWPSRRSLLLPLAVALTIAALTILFVLRVWSDAVVRVTPSYQFMYFMLGVAWLKVVESLFVWGGVSARDDVMERGNAAAVPAIGGSLIGVACAYAGGNIGDGPGWWVVVVSAVCGSVALALVWMWLSRLTRVIDTITIDRDMAAGVRFGALMIACGAIAGRAVAGDWQGLEGLSVDFLTIAPAMLPLLVLAIGFERLGVPTRDRPHPPVVLYGAVPAVLFLSSAAAFLVWLGPPQ